MKKIIKIKLILLIFIAIFLHSFSITPRTVAQDESIDIRSFGCSGCSQEHNTYFAEWVWSGSIPSVSIYYYNLSMTVIEYTITSMTPNNGSYEWQMPSSHTLDGEYYLVVFDYSNNNIYDAVTTDVYPVLSTTSNIPGYSIILIGLMIGLTIGIIAIPLTIKSRKR